MDYNEYQKKMGNSRGIGVSGKETTPIENEKFHSVYISGKTRNNELGQEERAGLFQIRGIETNLEEVFCIFLTSKLVNVKESKINGKTRLSCFSYRDTEPFKGKDGRICLSGDERNNDPFCSPCRSHIIVCGLLTDKNGKPKVKEDNSPVLVFIRGKGVKYGNVADYLYSLTELDLDPFFGSSEEESIAFEKNNVNQMRVVTRITKGSQNTDYGDKDVFSFNVVEGLEVSRKLTDRLLKLSTEIIEDFDKKFNWSSVKSNKSTTASSTNNSNSDPGFREEDMRTDNNSSEEKDPFAFEDDIPF